MDEKCTLRMSWIIQIEKNIYNIAYEDYRDEMKHYLIINDKKEELKLSESVAGQVRGKRIGYLLIKSGDDHRAWRIGRIRDALVEASGNMLFAGACGIGDANIGKMTWVTAIVSDMDNPNNSYGDSKNKTAFQRKNCLAVR